MKREYKYVAGGALAVLALAGVALASVYVADSVGDAPKQQEARVVNNQRYAAAQPVAQQPQRVECDDNNIVGTIGGGLAGGLIGAQFGSGSGQTAATVGGALGGAALGNKYIPTRGATCD